jgi:hypothetical protein
MLDWLALMWICIALIVIGFTVLILGMLVGIAIELTSSFLELKRERKGINDDD